MLINKEMLDVRFDGVMLNIKCTITGELAHHIEGEGKEKRKVYELRDGKPYPTFPPTPVEYRIDMTGATLRNALEYTESALTIRVANATRSEGVEAVRELNGKTLRFTELYSEKRVPVSNLGKAMGLLPKMTSAELAEVEKRIAEMKRGSK